MGLFELHPVLLDEETEMSERLEFPYGTHVRDPWDSHGNLNPQ
jgi:hypothetical protein